MGENSWDGRQRRNHTGRGHAGSDQCWRSVLRRRSQRQGGEQGKLRRSSCFACWKVLIVGSLFGVLQTAIMSTTHCHGATNLQVPQTADYLLLLPVILICRFYSFSPLLFCNDVGLYVVRNLVNGVLRRRQIWTFGGCYNNLAGHCLAIHLRHDVTS